MKQTTILWLLIAVLLIPALAEARITKITITSTQSPRFGDTSFGTVGQYEKLIGKVTGEVDPNDPRNEIIVDIKNAPKNARGMVEYSTDILILSPTSLARRTRRWFRRPTRMAMTSQVSACRRSQCRLLRILAGICGRPFLQQSPMDAMPVA